jgi:twitching motility protein PilT
MIPNSAIRNLIREDKMHQVYSQMQIGQGTTGMQTLNQCLASLYLTRKVTLEEAIGHSSDANELQQIIASGAGATGPGNKNAGQARSGAPPRG